MARPLEVLKHRFCFLKDRLKYLEISVIQITLDPVQIPVKSEGSLSDRCKKQT